MKHKLIIALLSIIASLSFAQSKIQIKTLEEDNGKALPYCHVCIRDLVTDSTKYFVTNEQGLANFSFNGHSVISISYMGFETVFDTITQSASQLEYLMKEQAFNFDEVVVTGQNKPISVDKSIYSIKLIGQQQIERTASNTLADLLKTQANIQINNDPSLGSSLKLQGISGENIKILIDGVPVIGRLNGNIDLSQLNLSEVDHIEIVEGPMSVIYGSNALGGVINIITKQNKYAAVKAGADLYYETVGVYNANGRFNWKKKNNGIDVNFGRNFFQGFGVNPNARRQDWKPKEQYNAGAQYSFTNEKLILRAKFDGFKESLLDRNNVTGPYYGNAWDTWYYTKRMNSSLQGDYQLSDLNSFKTIFSYSYYDRIKEKLTKDLSDLSTSPSEGLDDFDTSYFNAVMARGVYNRHTMSEVLEYQMGFDINWEDAKGKRIFNEYEQMADFALFLILKWKITDQLMFQPAIRAAYNTKYKAPLSPSLNLKYSWEKNSIRFSYARGFRAPSLKELYLYFYDSNHQIEGNPDLQAENSHNLNLTYDGHVLINDQPWSYKLALYYNQIFNKITLIQVDPENDLLYRNENIDKYEALGGNFSLSISPMYNINLDLAYSLTGRKDNSSGIDNFYFNSDATANLNYYFLENTALVSINYKYAGEYPVYVYIEDEGIGISYLDDYHNLDVNLSKKFFAKSLDIGLGVKNLFDNVQVNSTGGTGGGHGTSAGVSPLVGWGRTFFVSLKYQFTKYD